LVSLGYIDLSKRRVTPEDIIKCEEKFNKSKAVHSILRFIAEKHDLVLEDLYKSIAWPLSRKYGHAYDAFKMAIADAEAVFEGLEMSDVVRNELMTNIRRRLTPQPVKIRADIEVTCFGYEGIDAVKRALKEAETCSTEACEIKVKLVAPPLYVMLTTSLDKKAGIELLEKAITKVEASITASGGNLNVKMRPKAVSETDDLELAELMARVERENAEVSGDEASTEDEA
jgi:translation initiation factor 2 subunit 1